MAACEGLLETRADRSTINTCYLGSTALLRSRERCGWQVSLNASFSAGPVTLEIWINQVLAEKVSNCISGGKGPDDEERSKAARGLRLQWVKASTSPCKWLLQSQSTACRYWKRLSVKSERGCKVMHIVIEESPKKITVSGLLRSLQNTLDLLDHGIGNRILSII